MSTATSGSDEDDDIVTMELVDQERPHSRRDPLLSPEAARLAFLSLAIVAAATLLGALLVIMLAPKATVPLLVGALIVLVLVVGAEIALLFLARPQRAA